MAVFIRNIENSSRNRKRPEDNIVIGEREDLIQKSILLLKFGDREVIFRKAVARRFGEINLKKDRTIEELENLREEIINKRFLMSEKHCYLKNELDSVGVFGPVADLSVKTRNNARKIAEDMKNAERVMEYFSTQLEQVKGEIRRLKGLN